MKTDGDIHMYAIENDPRERAAIVGFDKRFVALPIRGKGIGAIAGYGDSYPEYIPHRMQNTPNRRSER